MFGKKKVSSENDHIITSKDPKDYTKTELSTDWEADKHHCTACNKSTGHNEYMSDICSGCGKFNTQVRFQRSFRKIYIAGSWKYQVRYKDGTEEIRAKWY